MHRKSVVSSVYCAIGLCLLWSAAASAQAPVFTDVTGPAGILNTLRGPGLAWGDFDGDSDLDIFITAWTLVGGSPINKLWRNNGDGTFTNTAAAAQVAGFNSFSSSAAWADFNNNGRLDLYVSNFPRDQQDILYQNNGGTFSILLPNTCLLYTSPSPRDVEESRMPSSA